uniref:Uncharacterized protein n=1 Tax=Plectus sambesii TaxID=2011161 RepID=A0A914W014_9BILA
MNCHFAKSLLLLMILIPLATGSTLYRFRNWRHAPRAEKKGGGRPLNLVPAAIAQHDATQKLWPESIFYKGKRKVDLNSKGNVGRYWIRHFNHPDEDILNSALDSWNPDPYGYDPTAPLSSELFK